MHELHNVNTLNLIVKFLPFSWSQVQKISILCHYTMRLYRCKFLHKKTAVFRYHLKIMWLCPVKVNEAIIKNKNELYSRHTGAYMNIFVCFVSETPRIRHGYNCNPDSHLWERVCVIASEAHVITHQWLRGHQTLNMHYWKLQLLANLTTFIKT